MIGLLEDKRTEFKLKITDSLEKEVIAFLNTDGGNIFIGIDDKGNIQGNLGNIDLLQRTIKDRLKDNIMPSILGLFDVVVNEKEEKIYIQIIVAKGNEKPYYLRGMGMTPDSCFIRVGSAVESMNNEFNYIAYLLSDNNNISVQFAKYDGNDVYNLIENEDFGFCSLIKITDNILNKIMLENKTYTKIENPTRKEIKMYDYNAVKELITNALIHNDWCNGYSPKFEIFNNKLVISSNGGIQEGVSQEEFLEGFSNPRNPELMRIFRDLNFVEQLGTGIQRVLKTYDKKIFEFFPNHIRVTIPFNRNEFKENIISLTNVTYKNLNKLQKSIIKLITDNPNITQEELARLLDVNKRTIIRNFKVLIDEKYIERIGANKNGYWKVNKK